MLDEFMHLFIGGGHYLHEIVEFFTLSKFMFIFIISTKLNTIALVIYNIKVCGVTVSIGNSTKIYSLKDFLGG